MESNPPWDISRISGKGGIKRYGVAIKDNMSPNIGCSLIFGDLCLFISNMHDNPLRIISEFCSK